MLPLFWACVDHTACGRPLARTSPDDPFQRSRLRTLMPSSLLARLSGVHRPVVLAEYRRTVVGAAATQSCVLDGSSQRLVLS